MPLNYDSVSGDFTRKIGRYTLRFKVAVTDPPRMNRDKPGTLSTQRGPTSDSTIFGKTVNGTDYFVPHDGDNSELIILARKFLFTRIQLRDIRFTDEAGKSVPGYQMAVADAEDTTLSEMISVNNSTSEDSTTFGLSLIHI